MTYFGIAFITYFCHAGEEPGNDHVAHMQLFIPVIYIVNRRVFE